MSAPWSSILFLVEGARQSGTGHLRRCATLGKYLRSQGHRVRFQVLADPSEMLPCEALKSILDDLDWQATTHPLSCEAAVVVVDVIAAAQRRAVQWCRDQQLACLALDYLQPDELPDIVVTLKDLSGQMQAAFAKRGRQKAYYEGIAYAMIRPTIRQQRSKLTLPGQKQKLDVLVTLGGADPQSLTLEALDLLRPWQIYFDHVIIVLGPGVGDRLAEQVMQDAATLNFEVLRAPENFDELLGRADLVICNGGGSLLESLCLSRLVAVLPQTQAEITFASSFCEQGACVWAKDIRQMIESTSQERLEFARRAASIVDGNGLERLSTLINDLANSKINV